MPERTADRESVELAGDALADWVWGLGLDPAMVRPYGAAKPILAALVAAGWRRITDQEHDCLHERVRAVVEAARAWRRNLTAAPWGSPADELVKAVDDLEAICGHPREEQ